MQQFFMAFVRAARVVAIAAAIALAVLLLVLIFAPELLGRLARCILIGLVAVGLISLAVVWLNYHRK